MPLSVGVLGTAAEVEPPWEAFQFASDRQVVAVWSSAAPPTVAAASEALAISADAV